MHIDRPANEKNEGTEVWLLQLGYRKVLDIYYTILDRLYAAMQSPLVASALAFEGRFHKAHKLGAPLRSIDYCRQQQQKHHPPSAQLLQPRRMSVLVHRHYALPSVQMMPLYVLLLP